jgi:hypothetical protein
MRKNGGFWLDKDKAKQSQSPAAGRKSEAPLLSQG